jgi:hypothetical protein
MKDHLQVMNISEDFQHDIQVLINKMVTMQNDELFYVFKKHHPEMFTEDDALQGSTHLADVVLNITRGLIMLNFAMLFKLDSPKIEEKFTKYLEAIQAQGLMEIDMYRQKIN